MAKKAVPARRPGGRTAVLRERMLAAATELVARHGVDGFSYEQVAELAGVNKTSVYRNWPDRAKLVVDVFTSFAAESIGVPDSGDLHADLVEFLVTMAETLSTPQGRALSSVANSAVSNAELDAIVDTAYAQRVVIVHRRLAVAVERGELPPVDAYFLTELLSGPVHLFMNRGKRSFTRPDAEQVVTVVLAGLRAVHRG